MRGWQTFTRVWLSSRRRKQNRRASGARLPEKDDCQWPKGGSRQPTAFFYFSLSQISGVLRLMLATTCGVMTIMSSSVSDSLVLFTIA